MAVLSFETISFAPIDLDLIDQSLLNKKEINWLNNYHQDVFDNLKKFNKHSCTSEGSLSNIFYLFIKSNYQFQIL